VQPAFMSGSAPLRLDGAPSFHILESESLRPEALLCGGLLSLLTLGATAVLTGYAGNHRPQRAAVAEPQRPTYARRTALSRPSPQISRGAEEEAIASGRTQPLSHQSSARDAIRARISAVAENEQLDAAERQRVIDGAIANLREHYVDREVAQKMGDALLAHEKRGDDDGLTEGGGFADSLTKQMRDVSQDMHLTMEYSRDRLPDHPHVQTAEDLARYRRFLEQNNCFVTKVKILPHNIGFLKLDWFADHSVCQSTAVAAMDSLNRVDAIIFDLRDNSGGDPGMVSLIAAYLFDHPEYWYNPRESPTRESWTQSPVQGNRLADKLVYLLTSASTWSGGEQFSYDLKMLKRATLVGETTRGGAHAGVWHRIDDHFGMGIPEVKTINPFSKNDWEGTGVKPDVAVRAADALETAEKLAESKLKKK
jgi:Peptidase family S41